jgi:hypothetical protein
MSENNNHIDMIFKKSLAKNFILRESQLKNTNPLFWLPFLEVVLDNGDD